MPVAVFVSPRGAHAGSAGTYITAAAHIAAMAPGTNIGAATPVSGGGEELPETLADKVTNDAAALIRSIADERGRNADALEETVRSAASFSAAEAVEAGIIDLVADNISDLLNAVDGLTVVTAAGEQQLDTAGSATERISLQWRERFVDFIANPNIAFLLLSLGGLGLVIEMITPRNHRPRRGGRNLSAPRFPGVGQPAVQLGRHRVHRPGRRVSSAGGVYIRIRGTGASEPWSALLSVGYCCLAGWAALAAYRRTSRTCR